jgi:hypothetical protein
MKAKESRSLVSTKSDSQVSKVRISRQVSAGNTKTERNVNYFHKTAARVRFMSGSRYFTIISAMDDKYDK